MIFTIFKWEKVKEHYLLTCKQYINFKFQCSQFCPFLYISVMFFMLPWQNGVVVIETT